MRIIDNFGQWKPNVVIWENVPSVLNKNNISSFNAYIETMEELYQRFTDVTIIDSKVKGLLPVFGKQGVMNAKQ